MMHRFHARRAARAAVATAFVSLPEPHTIGTVVRGQQLVAGKFLFSGLFVEGKEHSIWDIADAYPEVSDEAHGFGWLDDLAAVGDDAARTLARAWVMEWIDRYGDGRRDGWTPGVTGRRLMRLINHGPFVLRGQDKTISYRFFQSLARQALFLSRRWNATEPGVRRFEALAGIIYASLSLKSMELYTASALNALTRDCDSQISETGTIASRKPQDLLDILSLLNWTVHSLTDADHPCPPALTNAIARITPTLRALRHADGGLARFHGGGNGVDGRLDEALVASRVKTQPKAHRHMGYARLAAGRTTLIADAAPPPQGAASADGHASTLAFELTSGRRPLVVNCGSGARFGEEWRRASRATPSHSTMMIEGVSSSHLGLRGRGIAGAELLTELPTRVDCILSETAQTRKLELSHNGYQPSHGLTHARTLQLSLDGRSLEGEDLLTTLCANDEAIFDGLRARGSLPYVLRFHLHPDVEAAIDTAATAVSLTLKSGEVWVLRHDGTAKLGLTASVYLQNHQLKPVPTQQVVLSGHAMAYATRVRWSLAKTQDTPAAVRDFAQADPLDAVD
ncbi:heparinase II/III family protein [Yoonia algicola]|uniref:Heparinase II/III family protein n=1 Tax=Yoonia algicola TaxID=3137368 RepID=A0AAN0M1Y2_9RHOB